MNLPRVLALCLVTAAVLSCAGSRGRRPAPPGPEVERAAAERQLRRMFPGVQGEITRESIAEELERERAALDPAEGVRAATIDAVEAGDFDRARDLLSELLAGEHIEQAGARMREGDAKAALAELDRALEMAPRSASIACLRGEAALTVAEADRESALRRSALASFFAAASLDPVRTGPRAWLGASRAARGLGQPAEASEYARRGLEALPAPRDAPDPDPESTRRCAELLQRSLAEAGVDEFAAARTSGAPADASAARAPDAIASRARDALEGLIGRTPEDAWGWERLAELAQAQGANEEARDLALRGLRITPDDPALLERLASAARATGGPSAAVKILEPFCRRHPDIAIGAWELGLALFDAASGPAATGASSRDPREGLVAAEKAFARCRELDARNRVQCRAMEAQCRGALGFWLLSRADLEGAHQAFLSMQDAVKDGLALEVRGSGQRGTDGLFRVAEGWGERVDPGHPGSIDNLEQAARICDLLHDVDPDDPRFAAEAGRFNRDSAVALELRASALAEQGKAGEADRLLGRAREMMESAYAAWRDAAALAPEDERNSANAGAVLARYLQREPDAARTFLERAVAQAEHEVPALLAAAEAKGIDDAERAARRKILEDERTLVGDACRDLGLVHLELLGNPSKAREWFERSRKAGPDPRPELDSLVERCEKAMKGTLDARLRDEDRWAPLARSGRKP